MKKSFCNEILHCLSEDNAETAPFLGREKEISLLQSAWGQCCASDSSARRSVFVHCSGRPGAGKTAAVGRAQRAAFAAPHSNGSVKASVHWINCTHVRSAIDFFRDVWTHLVRPAAPAEAAAGEPAGLVALVEAIDQTLLSSGAVALSQQQAVFDVKTKTKKVKKSIGPPPLVLVADEIHELARRFPDCLARLAVWQSRAGSQFSVFGISNALNTVDCFATVDQAVGSASSSIVRVHFEPYSADAILAAVRARLSTRPDRARVDGPGVVSETAHSKRGRHETTDGSSVSVANGDDAGCSGDLAALFEPAALKFCALKVAKGGGDMRRAFALLSRAVNLYQQAKTDSAAPSPSDPNCDGAELGGKITVAHVSAAARDAAAPDSKLKIAEMPVPHKHLLCATVLAFADAASSSAANGNKIKRRKYGTNGSVASSGPKRKRTAHQESQGVPFLKVYGKFLELNARMGVPPAQRCSRDNLFIMCQAVAEAKSIIELRRASTPAQSTVLLSVPLETIKTALAQDAVYQQFF